REKRYIQVFQSNNSLDNTINHITGRGTEVWMATRNGVIIYDSKAEDMQQFSTRDGLPHNNINQIFIDSKGRGWVATTSNRLYFIKDRKLSLGYEIQYYTKKNEFRAITEDTNGELWAVTYGNGLYHFASDSIYNYTTWDGMISDYCYSIESDMANNIWIGHRLGFSRFIKGDNLILTYGRELGITSDCNPNSIFMEKEGAVIFGTTGGIIRYDASLDKGSRIPPISNITSISFSDRVVDLSEDIILPFDKYKLNIEFIGLSYRNPEMVTYQYKLENYDQEWSEMTRFPMVTYGIADGEYTFLLRSYNRDWQTSEEPLSVHFIVRKPYWKTWWFITTLVIVVLGSVILIIKIRERNHKKLQAFLQKSLDERTREVVEQKEEIEQKNREITDSINYAQRIQASILPPLQKLRENFPGFFVFYMPRDIVSGDFYWFDKVGKDRFIIVCADSTGHGVPGAFMSMIGATLIKDIVNRQDIVKPSQILTTLDTEITETLNQNIEAEQSTDGMDIIVCEINTATRKVGFASAMRPVIFYHNGEQIYLKGNRSSVGGEIIEAKVFEDQEFQLSEGDIIYMFSDGYPDQFGGPLGKKYKMVRLKNLLDDVYLKSMEEQYEYVKNNFELWKSDFEQVDDILFMAIKM
ncbi:MAG: SpoIIE family protein phosphatase, partial [Bacteroidales bacterium]